MINVNFQVKLKYLNIMITIFIFSCLLAIANGIYDGGVFGLLTYRDPKTKINIHMFFVPLRFIMYGCLLFFSYSSVLFLVLSAIVMGLAFSFFHNGIYYETRKYLGEKDYSFFYESKDSTAKIELRPIVRTIMLIIAIIIVIVYSFII
jgi:hypothetical protein